MISATVLSYQDLFITEIIRRLIASVTGRGDVQIVSLKATVDSHLKDPSNVDFSVKFSFGFQGEKAFHEGFVDLPLTFSKPGLCQVRQSIRIFDCCILKERYLVDWRKAGLPGWTRLLDEDDVSIQADLTACLA